MAINELEKLVAEREEWVKILDEAKEMVESLTDEIKAEMLSRETEELVAGKYIVRWSTFFKSLSIRPHSKKSMQICTTCLLRPQRRDGSLLASEPSFI